MSFCSGVFTFSALFYFFSRHLRGILLLSVPRRRRMATVSALPLGFVNRKPATAEDPAVAIKEEIETAVELVSVDIGSADGKD